jgi:hypothetical protein
MQVVEFLRMGVDVDVLGVGRGVDRIDFRAPEVVKTNTGRSVEPIVASRVLVGPCGVCDPFVFLDDFEEGVDLDVVVRLLRGRRGA